MGNLAELGVGAVIAILIIQMVLNFLKSKNSKNPGISAKLEELVETTNKIWDIHNRYDDNGSPLWYVPRSWAQTQKDIIEICHSIAETQREIARTLERMEKRKN